MKAFIPLTIAAATAFAMLPTAAGAQFSTTIGPDGVTIGIGELRESAREERWRERRAMERAERRAEARARARAEARAEERWRREHRDRHGRDRYESDERIILRLN